MKGCESKRKAAPHTSHARGEENECQIIGRDNTIEKGLYTILTLLILFSFKTRCETIGNHVIKGKFQLLIIIEMGYN